MKALQLSMVLVPLHVREELRCLLNFMRVAAEEDAVRLSIKVPSRFYTTLVVYFFNIFEWRDCSQAAFSLTDKCTDLDTTNTGIYPQFPWD